MATERQALKSAISATSTPPFFVVKFDCDDSIAHVPAKLIINPDSATLSVKSECVVRWQDRCRYEAVVLATAGDRLEAKRLEAELVKAIRSTTSSDSLSNTPSPPPKPKKRRRKSQKR